MSLILPMFSFGRCTSNLDSGTPPAATVGTNFTAGLNDTDGTAVTVLSALDHDVHFLVIEIGGISVSTGNGNALADILVDPAGGTSWTALIEYLMCGFTSIPTAGTIGLNQRYAFPIFIKAGTSIGIRSRTAHTANITSGRVVMWAYGEPSRPDMWWCGQAVQRMNIEQSVSASAINVTPGNAVFGSWASSGTILDRKYRALQFALGGSDSSAVAIGCYWEIGLNSTKIPGTPTFYTSMATTEVMARVGFGVPIFVNLPESGQLQCRGIANAAAEAYSFGFWGVY